MVGGGHGYEVALCCVCDDEVRVVPQIFRFPVGIVVTRINRPPWHLELVGKHELAFLSIEACPGF